MERGRKAIGRRLVLAAAAINTGERPGQRRKGRNPASSGRRRNLPRIGGGGPVGVNPWSPPGNTVRPATIKTFISYQLVKTYSARFIPKVLKHAKESVKSLVCMAYFVILSPR